MSRTIIVSWDLPVVRDDGSPMPPTEVDFTEVELSADAGKTYTSLGKVVGNGEQTVQKDVADGDYTFRLTVTGKNGKKGKPVTAVGTVTTPAPGAVTNVKITVS